MLGRPTNRWTAFGLHLLISAAIFIALAAMIVFIWYPGFLFNTDGGWQGIRLIAGIDIILGPLLTLIVYKVHKKSLRFDLSCIAVVQIAALAYGTHLVYNERPIAVIFADGRFSTASNSSYNFYGIEPSSIEIIATSKKPVWIYVELPPLMPGKTKQDRFSQIGPEHLWVSGYKPFFLKLNQLENYGLTQIDNNQPRLSQQSTQRYFSLLSRYYEGYLLMDLTTGNILKTIITKSTESYGVKQSQ